MRLVQLLETKEIPMRGHEILAEVHDQKDDKYTYIEIDHVRRPRITLKHLQKLRKTRSIEQLEASERQKDASQIYGRSREE
jgi:hypothetical protein